MIRVIRASVKIENDTWVEIIKQILAGGEPFAIVSTALGIPPEVFQWLDLDDRDQLVHLSEAVQVLRDFDEGIAPQLATEEASRKRTILVDRMDKLVRVLMHP
jgi:aminopeptidase C